MKYLAALPLMIGLCSTAIASPLRLECLDAYDAKTRLALIEIDIDAATIHIYSESTRDWRSAVNVSIADSTFSYVEHGSNDAASAASSVTIDRVSGKYTAYTAHSPRKDGKCRKVG